MRCIVVNQKGKREISFFIILHVRILVTLLQSGVHLNLHVDNAYIDCVAYLGPIIYLPVMESIQIFN